MVVVPQHHRQAGQSTFGKFMLANNRGLTLFFILKERKHNDPWLK
ncbi:Uncharacterised protein [Enterobacter cloacae]|nr:Uncharacterised protein [Enterobacter cloacae]